MGQPPAETDFVRVFDIIARCAKRPASCLNGRHTPGHAH